MDVVIIPQQHQVEEVEEEERKIEPTPIEESESKLDPSTNTTITEDISSHQTA